MQASMQEPSAVNHIKRQRHPLHSSAGLHRTPAHLWSGVDRPPATPHPPPLSWLPWTSSVCCLCSPVTGWSSRWGGFVWPWVVRHTPPLILPSESLQRTMANICELPECSIRKRRPVGWECVHVGGGVRVRGVDYWSWGWARRSSAMCLCMSISHQCLGYVSWLANGLGVLSPVLEIALTPFSAWGRPEFTHAHTGKLVTWLLCFKQWNQLPWTCCLPNLMPFYISHNLHLSDCVYSFCSFPAHVYE